MKLFRNRLKEQHEKELKSIRNHRYYIRHRNDQKQQVRTIKEEKKVEPEPFGF